MDATVAMYVSQGMHGLAYGMVLFLLASGLTLILGMMGVLNLAHTGFFMLALKFMDITGGKVDAGNPNAWTFEKIFHHFPFMKDRTHQKGGHLSGGEQQMLTIGRTLMGNPRLLMVDEPTEGLSPVMVKAVRDVLKEISRSGISILLVEHNFKMAMSVVDRVYLMGKAHIGYSGTVEELEDDKQARANYLEV